MIKPETRGMVWVATTCGALMGLLCLLYFPFQQCPVRSHANLLIWRAVHENEDTIKNAAGMYRFAITRSPKASPKLKVPFEFVRYCPECQKKYEAWRNRSAKAPVAMLASATQNQ